MPFDRHLKPFVGTPDDWAELATDRAQAGWRDCAHEEAVMSYRARADWIVFNGRWIARPLAGRIAE